MTFLVGIMIELSKINFVILRDYDVNKYLIIRCMCSPIYDPQNSKCFTANNDVHQDTILAGAQQCNDRVMNSHYQAQFTLHNIYLSPLWVCI